jgi:hypothetical protein
MRKIDKAIAAEALQWIGTPFVWDQSAKAHGCDCKGLIAGVLREIGRPEGISFYAAVRGYRIDRPPPAALLLEIDSVVKERPLEVLFHKTPLHSVWRVPARPKCR